MKKIATHKNTKNKSDTRVSTKKGFPLLSARWETKIFVSAIVLLFFVPCLLYVLQASGANGYFGFPLDDAWIHLTFARNIHDFGAFSYYQHEQVTSGSTSPLYTVLLAVLFFVSRNEFLISYVAGIVFACMAVAVAFFLYRHEFTENKHYAVFLAAILALQPKLQFIAVSGMETTLFIALLLLGAFCYRTRRVIELGIVLGLLVWARPDGFIFWVAIGLDYLVHRYLMSEHNTPSFSFRQFFTSFGIASTFAVLYFGFNEWLSGTMLPNSWRSKVMLYQDNPRLLFLQNEVWSLLTRNEFIFLWVFFAIAGGFVLFDMFRRRGNAFFLYFIFIIGLIAAYTIFVPFSHLYGRYLLPVIPFYVLLSGYGLVRLLKSIPKAEERPGLKQIITTLVLVVFAVTALLNISTSIEQYQVNCKYYHDRHVVTAEWIAAHTPEGAIIGVHDIGAIGYYGHRKLFDMAGLCSPEMMNVGLLNDIKIVNAVLKEKQVSYLVVLSSWFDVSNAKLLFMPQTDQELMYVYQYLPEKTRLLSYETMQFLHMGTEAANSGSEQDAEIYFLRACASDTQSARVYFETAKFYYLNKKLELADKYLKEALHSFPEYPEAINLKYSLRNNHNN